MNKVYIVKDYWDIVGISSSREGAQRIVQAAQEDADDLLLTGYKTEIIERYAETLFKGEDRL